METATVIPLRPTAPAATERRAVVAYGLWLRAGLVGAAAFAAGLVQLFTGEATALSALALSAAGGALAVVGWRRALASLDAADRIAPSASAPAQRIGLGAACAR